MYNKYQDSYDFDEQKRQGDIAEKLIDDYFSEWYFIKNITVKQQLIDHYDRIFVDLDSGNQYKVEYKNDLVAIRTGNFYIETEISNGRKGWFFKSKADWLAVLIGKEIYLASFCYLRLLFAKKSKCYKIKKSGVTITPNGSFNSVGYLMPIKDLMEISNIYQI
jgi:hypothetical protein